MQEFHSEPKRQPTKGELWATWIVGVCLLGFFGTATIIACHWMITRFW